MTIQVYIDPCTVNSRKILAGLQQMKVDNAKKALTDEKNTTKRSPVMPVHCDYTAESGPLRVKQLLGDEANDLLKRRVAFINVWKPVDRVVEERPFAMCDAQSCEDIDIFKLHSRYRDCNGENSEMKHLPKHKWYYSPKMTLEQVVLLKMFDSDPDVARFVGHTAFLLDAPLHESQKAYSLLVLVPGVA